LYKKNPAEMGRGPVGLFALPHGEPAFSRYRTVSQVVVENLAVGTEVA
jgi:hypothetical protein